MRVLLFNLATDADDPILGFTTRWICALAARVEFVHVVTMRTGRLEVPGNVRVHSVGKEKRRSEPRRVLEFYRLLFRILREDRIDVCFSHMIPVFTVLAAPVLRWAGVPIITWYAHPSLTWTLRLAHQASNHMVASLAKAYPYRPDKFTAIGQGIDTNLFSLDTGESPEEPPVILSVGRLSPVKDHGTLLNAAALLKQKWRQLFRVVILGGPATSRDESYVRSLHEQVTRLGLEETVFFEAAVPIERLTSWYHRCTVTVNMTPTGSGDKVVWEAMACGRPCVVANEGFSETLGRYADPCLYTYGDSEQLAARLQWLLSLSTAERAEMGMYFRRQVESMHSLDRLAENLIKILRSANSRKGLLDHPR
jgi:glycosyltransferase involved in cell wall biosynthesis